MNQLRIVFEFRRYAIRLFANHVVPGSKKPALGDMKSVQFYWDDQNPSFDAKGNEASPHSESTNAEQVGRSV